MKKIILKLLFLPLALLLTSCRSSESEVDFYFESNAENGKKLVLSFAASPRENAPEMYSCETASTNVSIRDENENVTHTDILRTPLSGQGVFAFPYDPEENISVKLFSCGDDVYMGLVGIPAGDGTYCVTVYVCRDEILTVINDLWPVVKTIDDITVEENTISFYDLSKKENSVYRIDFERLSSKLMKYAED